MKKETLQHYLIQLYCSIFYIALTLIFLRGKVLKFECDLFSLSLTSVKNLLFFLFALGALLWLFLPSTQKWLKTSLNRLVLIWLVPIGISLFFSINKMESVATIGVLVCYLAFLYLFLYTVRTKEQVLKVLLLAGSITTFVAIVNIFYSYWMHASTPSLTIIEDYPFWPGKNMFGFYLVINISFILGFLFFYKKWQPKLKWSLVGMFLIQLFCLFLTASRGAWLSMGGVLLIFLFLRPKFFLPLLFISIAMLLIFAPTSLKERVQSIGDLKDDTIKERLLIWRSSLQMIQDHPVTGVGPGNFLQAYQNYKSSYIRLEWAGEHAHNLYLHLWAEMGILGFLALIFTFTFLLKKGIQLYYKEEDLLLKSVRFGALLSMVGWMIYSLGDSTFNGNFSHASMFHVNLCMAMVIGLLVRE